MWLNPMQELEGCEDDLLEDVPRDHSHQILMMIVTKKVLNVPDVVLSPGAQRGYRFLDMESIVCKGFV